MSRLKRPSISFLKSLPHPVQKVGVKSSLLLSLSLIAEAVAIVGYLENW